MCTRAINNFALQCIDSLSPAAALWCPEDTGEHFPAVPGALSIAGRAVEQQRHLPDQLGQQAPVLGWVQPGALPLHSVLQGPSEVAVLLSLPLPLPPLPPLLMTLFGLHPDLRHPLSPPPLLLPPPLIRHM